MIYPENKIAQICEEIELLSKVKVGLERFNTTNPLKAKNLIIEKLNENLELMQSFNKSGKQNLKKKIEQNERDIYQSYSDYNVLLDGNERLKELANSHILESLKAFAYNVKNFCLKYFFEVLAVFWFLGFISISLHLKPTMILNIPNEALTAFTIAFSIMLTILLGIYPACTFVSFKFFSGYTPLNIFFNIISAVFIVLLVFSDALDNSFMQFINQNSNSVIMGYFLSLILIVAIVYAFRIKADEKKLDTFFNALVAFGFNVMFDMMFAFVLKANNPDNSIAITTLMTLVAMAIIFYRTILSSTPVFHFKATIITTIILIFIVIIFRGDRLIATFGLDKIAANQQAIEQKIEN